MPEQPPQSDSIGGPAAGDNTPQASASPPPSPPAPSAPPPDQPQPQAPPVRENIDPRPVPPIIEHVRKFVTLFAIGVWLVFGLILWLPLLMRMTAYFIGMVTIDAFSRRVEIEQVQKRLDFAIDFYIYGFRRIIDSRHRADPGPIELGNLSPVNTRAFFKSVAGELAWTIIFWLFFFVLVWAIFT